MKITILTHPNQKMQYLEALARKIKNSAKIPVQVSCSWKNVKNAENIEGIKIYALSDPFETIENCMINYDQKATDKSARWQAIKDRFGNDLKDYSPIEAASLSYLLWLEIAKMSELDCVFKIEEPSALFDFLIGKGILDENFSFKYHIFPRFKIRNFELYKDVSFGTLNLIGKYCRVYKYDNYLKDLR
jgi:hypothetical protein